MRKVRLVSRKNEEITTGKRKSKVAVKKKQKVIPRVDRNR